MEYILPLEIIFSVGKKKAGAAFPNPISKFIPTPARVQIQRCITSPADMPE
jgi:hypothetical protein